MSVPILVKIDL